MNSPSQVALNFSWEEAIAEDIKALGGRKKLAPRLWPAEDEETAQERLKAALAPGHKQALKPSEILKIKQWARDAGSYALVNFEAQELGYRVEWVHPQDEADELRRDVRDLLQHVNQKLDRIERAEQRVAGSTVRELPR